MQGAIVEVQIQADKEEPASWWEAEVKEMREDFIKVCFLAGGDSIVESSRLRPAFSRGVAPSTAQLSKQTVRLTDGVRAAPGRGVRGGWARGEREVERRADPRGRQPSCAVAGVVGAE